MRAIDCSHSRTDHAVSLYPVFAKQNVYPANGGGMFKVVTEYDVPLICFLLARFMSCDAEVGSFRPAFIR